jgi:hypothetical protein
MPTQEEYDKLKGDRDGINASLLKVQTACDQKIQELQDTKSAHVGELAALKDQVVTARADAKKQLIDMADRHNAALAAALKDQKDSKEAADAASSLQAQYIQKVDAMQKKIEDLLKRAAVDAARIDNLCKSHAKEIKDLNSAHAKEIADLKAQQQKDFIHYGIKAAITEALAK